MACGLFCVILVVWCVVSHCVGMRWGEVGCFVLMCVQCPHKCFGFQVKDQQEAEKKKVVSMDIQSTIEVRSYKQEAIVKGQTQ